MDIFKYINSNTAKFLCFNILNNNFGVNNEIKQKDNLKKISLNKSNDSIQISTNNNTLTVSKKRRIIKNFNKLYKLENINSIRNYIKNNFKDEIFNNDNIYKKLLKSIVIKNVRIKHNYLKKKNFIDRGSSGKVFKVTENNKDYAIKMFSKKDTTLENIKKEISFQAFLSENNNFVKIYDFYKNKDSFFIKMDFFPNRDVFKNITGDGNLFKKMRKGKIYYQIINCVKKLHKKNIAHRDIKPENIFLDNAYNAFLGDFGESVRIEADKEYEINCNLLSMPDKYVLQYKDGVRETFMDLKKNDIYALGLTILSIETNKISPDFNRNDIDGFITKRNDFIEDNLEKLSESYTDLYTILNDMLSKNIDTISTIDDVINSEFYNTLITY